MIWLIVYIVGVILSFAIFIYSQRRKSDVTLGNIVKFAFLSSFLSWFTIVISVSVNINWDKVIIHKKK